VTRTVAIGMALWLLACGGAQSTAPSGERPPDPLSTVTPQELFQRGLAAASWNDFVRAEEYISAAIQRGWESPDAMPALISVCLQSGRYAAALNYAEPYLASHPDNWSLRMLVASVQLALNQTGEAERQLDRVLAVRAEEPFALYLMALIQRDRRGDMRAAISFFERYLAADPQGRHSNEARAAVEDLRLARRTEAPSTEAEAP
jgi:tetratricopeptide (TPR) repeat protein